MTKFFSRNWEVLFFATVPEAIIAAFMIVVQPCFRCDDGVSIGAVLYHSYVEPFTHYR